MNTQWLDLFYFMKHEYVTFMSLKQHFQAQKEENISS